MTLVIQTKKWKTLKGISQIIKSEAKEQKAGFFMFLVPLGANLLGNMIDAKFVIRVAAGRIRSR